MQHFYLYITFTIHPEIELLVDGRPVSCLFLSQDMAYILRCQFVYRPHRQFMAGDEVLRFLHHDSDLFQLLRSQTGIAAGDNDHLRRLYPDTGYTEKQFIVRLIDIDRKHMRVPRAHDNFGSTSRSSSG